MTEGERRQLNIYLGAIRDGVPEALDSLYLLVGGRMFALARSIGKNISDAEDIVQDSLVRIALKIKSFSKDTNGYAWVMKITRNVALDFLRKKGVRAEENIDDFFNLACGDYDEDKRDDAILLEQAINRLDSDERKAVYYTYYMDMTVRETAKSMGISKSAAARLIGRAENRLKSFLENGTKERN